MTVDDLRTAMRKRFETMTMREWCGLTGCNLSHVSQFLNGKRVGPPNDMLRALNLRVDYVKNKRSALSDATGSAQ